MAKTKVAILFGGISAEHEVSIMTAKSIMDNIDTAKFEVIPVEISQNGDFELEKVREADVVFPAMHGVGGEDGTIQGFCEVIQKPYVGAGVEASILALDKIVQKQIFKTLGLPIPSYQFFTKKEWQEKPAEISNNIVTPVFIKPAHTGSTIGISKVTKIHELQNAVVRALEFDDKIIVEEALDDIREIEVAVLGNDTLTISEPGEITPKDEFYTYDNKYNGDGAELSIPAKLSKEKISEVQDLAERAYRALGCRGMARVDFFIEKPEGKVYINELNTIPGFTKTSMYPKLMEASGISYKELLTRLINLAM